MKLTVFSTPAGSRDWTKHARRKKTSAMGEVTRTIYVPVGYRYVEPVSCVDRPDIRGTSNGTHWQRLWPREYRRLDSRCSSGVVSDLERTHRFACADRSCLQQQALLCSMASGADNAQAKLQEAR